jgi:hypothetical protein
LHFEFLAKIMKNSAKPGSIRPSDNGDETADQASDVFHRKRVKADSIEAPQWPASALIQDSHKTTAPDHQRHPDGSTDAEESAERLPLHLQQLVEDFYRDNRLNAKNGPCSPGLKAPCDEENDRGQQMTFVHGITGKPLVARRCLVRKNTFALVVQGGGLSQESIIRFYPQQTGIRGVFAWMVWKGLQGVEKEFLIFKLVGANFTNARGRKRKELSDLQKEFKKMKRDPFDRIVPKSITKGAKRPVTSASKRTVPKATGTSRKPHETGGVNLLDLQAGNPHRQIHDNRVSTSSGGEVVDLTEGAPAIKRSATPIKSEPLASSAIVEQLPGRVDVSFQPTKSAGLSGLSRTSTTISGSTRPVSFLPNHMRENTFFAFVNESNIANRTRRFDTCDSVGKLFLQADVSGLVQKSDEEAALSLSIPGRNSLLVIPNKDNESFEELVEAIASARCWKKGQSCASCRLEVRSYG